MRKIELVLEVDKYKGYEINGYLYEPDNGKVEKILYVIHGLTEHMGRYEQLAKTLTQQCIAVVGIDLKGHGKNNPYSSVASFGKDGWKKVLYDLHYFYDYLYIKYPNPKIYMLGFSLGSFLLREYINEYHSDTIAGAIIMGTGYQPSFVLSMVMGVVKGEIDKVGYDQTTPTIQKLSFGEYNKKFKPNSTSSDWLCSDNNSLDEYINDELCKKEISAGLFYDLLSSMKKTSVNKAYHNANKELPLLLISGSKDPVGNMSKGVKQVYKMMSDAGFNNITLEIVEGARHDLLHEHASKASLKAINIIEEFMK